MSGAYEEQERAAGERKTRNGRVARDLAAYLAEVQPETASDYQNGGIA
jgi:hypothetical protein